MTPFKECVILTKSELTNDLDNADKILIAIFTKNTITSQNRMPREKEFHTPPPLTISSTTNFFLFYFRILEDNFLQRPWTFFKINFRLLISVNQRRDQTNPLAVFAIMIEHGIQIKNSICKRYGDIMYPLLPTGQFSALEYNADKMDK